MFELENEYGISCVFRGQRRLSPDEAAREIFGRAVSAGRGSEVLLGNGGRLRLKTASQPEYATPESDGLFDLIARDKAGERILEELGVDAERRLREAGIDGDIHLLKTGAEPAVSPLGCRETYRIPRKTYHIGRAILQGGGQPREFGRLADMLVPFLVTRQLICGPGSVLRTPQGAVYSRNQVPVHRAVPGRARPAAVLAADRRARPRLPRRKPRPGRLLPATARRRGRSGGP